MIIVDRKRKQAHSDNQFNDPLGVEEAKREKARTIEIPKDSDNPVHKFLIKWPSPKFLLGKKIYCLTDTKEMVSGYISDVIPPYYLVLKNKGVAKFEDVITVEE